MYGIINDRIRYAVISQNSFILVSANGNSIVIGLPIPLNKTILIGSGVGPKTANKKQRIITIKPSKNKKIVGGLSFNPLLPLQICNFIF